MKPLCGNEFKSGPEHLTLLHLEVSTNFQDNARCHASTNLYGKHKQEQSPYLQRMITGIGFKAFGPFLMPFLCREICSIKKFLSFA